MRDTLSDEKMRLLIRVDKLSAKIVNFKKIATGMINVMDEAAREMLIQSLKDEDENAQELP